MKGPQYFLLTLAFILLFGCASQQLHRNGKHLASSLGVSESDILFLSYCEFNVLKKPSRALISTSKGIIALTDSDFCLVAPHYNNLFSKDTLIIPISDIDSISYATTQIQLRYGGEVMILQLDEESSPEFGDRKYDAFSHIFAQNGVPEQLPKQIYQIADKNQRRRENFNGLNDYKVAPQPKNDGYFN